MEFRTGNDFLEMGVIIGFQMYKNMEQGYMDFEVNGMDKIIKKNLSAEKKTEEKSNDKESVLQGLFDEGICNSLEAALRLDKGYKDARKIANETLDDIDNLELDKKQWSTVDRAFTSILSSAYCKAIHISSFLERLVLAERSLYASCNTLSMRIVIVTALSSFGVMTSFSIIFSLPPSIHFDYIIV